MGGAFERLFCPEGREFEQANLQKFKCPGGCRGGMLKLQFDWYIITDFKRKLEEFETIQILLQITIDGS